MTERENANQNPITTVIGHIKKRITFEEKFSQDLFILFVRYTIDYGISKDKIGAIGWTKEDKNVGLFLEHLDKVLKNKELYDVLIEWREQLPDDYSEYAITGGTLKGYEISKQRIQKFSSALERVRAVYNEKWWHISLKHTKTADPVIPDPLSPTKPAVVSSETWDKSQEGDGSEGDKFKESVQNFLKSLPSMQFCNDENNPKPYTVFSHDKDTVIIDPRFVNSSEEKPSVIYRRPIYYKTNATDTDRKEFSRWDLFQWLVTKGGKRIKSGNINANGNAQREVVFSKSFFKEGITSERGISNILEKLSKMGKEMPKKSAVIRDIEKNKKPEEGRIARSLIGSIQKAAQNGEDIRQILLKLLIIDDDRSLRVTKTKIHEKNRDDVASFFWKIMPLLWGRRVITSNDLTTILSENPPDQHQDKVKKMVDAINELWRKFDAYNEDKERAKKPKTMEMAAEKGLWETERRRIERAILRKEEIEGFATKIKEFLEKLWTMEFSHSQIKGQEYTILSLTDGKITIGRRFIDGDEASGNITDEPFTNEIFYRKKSSTKWERGSFTELFQPLITLEAEWLNNRDIKSHFGLRKIFDEGFSENGITTPRRLDAILKAWCKVANIEHELST